MFKIILSIIFSLVFIFDSLCNSEVVSDTSRNFANNSSVSIFGGVTGLGLELSYLVVPSSRLYLRGGISHIGYSKLYNFEYNSRSFIKIDPNIKLGIVYVGLDYLPFKKSSLYLITGVGYTHNVRTAINANTTTGVDISGTFISGEDFGNINFEIKWNKVVPFVGIGIGRVVPKRRFGVSAELGSYYIGSPKLFMEYTGILEITNIDEALPKIEKNMAGYAFLPYLLLKFRYRIFNGKSGD
jgi:hypothetical protein